MYKISQKTIRKMLEKPKVTQTLSYGKISFLLHEDNAILFVLNGKKIDWFHSCAYAGKRRIDTRSAKRIGIDRIVNGDTCTFEIRYREDDLSLIQSLSVGREDDCFTIRLTLSGKEEISSNRLVPLDFIYPPADSHPLFLSLDEKMLRVPYDNDMWIHYETVPLASGRTSYDVTAIFDEHSQNGLLIGALDFDVWKNGIMCSAYDARSFMAISGIADEGTHDLLPHGSIFGTEISSSRFVCGFYEDIRDGLEEYGKRCVNPNGIFRWDHGVPFGWNS